MSDVGILIREMNLSSAIKQAYSEIGINPQEVNISGSDSLESDTPEDLRYHKRVEARQQIYFLTGDSRDLVLKVSSHSLLDEILPLAERVAVLNGRERLVLNEVWELYEAEVADKREALGEMGYKLDSKGPKTLVKVL